MKSRPVVDHVFLRLWRQEISVVDDDKDDHGGGESGQENQVSGQHRLL